MFSWLKYSLKFSFSIEWILSILNQDVQDGTVISYDLLVVTRGSGGKISNFTGRVGWLIGAYIMFLYGVWGEAFLMVCLDY